MESALVAMSTPSLVLRYAAAFFFVLVAVAAAYALVQGRQSPGPRRQGAGRRG